MGPFYPELYFPILGGWQVSTCQLALWQSALLLIMTADPCGVIELGKLTESGRPQIQTILSRQLALWQRAFILNRRTRVGIPSETEVGQLNKSGRPLDQLFYIGDPDVICLAESLTVKLRNTCNLVQQTIGIDASESPSRVTIAQLTGVRSSTRHYQTMICAE